MDNVNFVRKSKEINIWWIEEKESMSLIWRRSLKRQGVLIEEGVLLKVELFKLLLNWSVGVWLQYKRINECNLKKESKEARSLNWRRSLTWSRTLSQESSSQWGVWSKQ